MHFHKGREELSGRAPGGLHSAPPILTHNIISAIGGSTGFDPQGKIANLSCFRRSGSRISEFIMNKRVVVEVEEVFFVLEAAPLEYEVFHRFVDGYGS